MIYVLDMSTQHLINCVIKPANKNTKKMYKMLQRKNKSSLVLENVIWSSLLLFITPYYTLAMVQVLGLHAYKYYASTFIDLKQ